MASGELILSLFPLFSFSTNHDFALFIPSTPSLSQDKLIAFALPHCQDPRHCRTHPLGSTGWTSESNDDYDGITIVIIN